MSTLSRVGLIVPSSNTVMEPDLHRQLGSIATISTTRIFLEQVTREAEIVMLERDLPKALRLIKTTAPDVVVFGCTSAGSLDGLNQDAAIGKTIEEETGAKAVTVVAAVLSELRALGAKKIAVLTPYREELTRTVTQCVLEGGYSVVHSAGMGLLENREIGEVPPETIIAFVESQMRGVHADCLFLSCTNWRAWATLEVLSRRLELPVISSNQATAAAVRRLGSRSALHSVAAPRLGSKP